MLDGKIDENLLKQTRKPAFQTLAVNIPGIVYRVYLRGQKRMEFFNDVLQEMTGYKAAELMVGEVCSIDPIIISEDRSYVLQVVQDALRDNKPFEIEYRTKHKNGNIRYFLERGRPIYGSNGRPEFIDGVILDITERKQAEETLAFKEHIIENSSSVIATCDLEGKMTYGNPSFLKQWGFDDPEEFLGRPFWEFWLVKERLDEIMQALRGEGSWCNEIKAVRKDGTIFDVQVSAAMVFDSGGNPIALTSTSIDITERKRAEELLRQLNETLEKRVQERTAELEKANTELIRYNERLVAFTKELQDFSSIASHDLQEPLRKVRAFGDMLATKLGVSLDETSADYLRRMQKAAATMQGLISSLLQYSRVTTHSKLMKETELGRSVEAALSNLELVIKRKNACLEIGDLPTIIADRVQMIQLFQNLISNALKFQRNGEVPHIKIYGRVRDENRTCEFCVEDKGIGFAEKYLDRIFFPFQRLHGKNSGYEGRGMGLAICKKIVERHGGAITARSAIGEGSTFIVTLPIRHAM